MSGASPASDRPLVSVGLPVFDGMPYVERALESLLAQDVADLEIVVCDNASTDGTGALVEEMAARDDRIRYVRNQTNIGGARNFNRAFRLSTGRYFRWACADDFVSPGVISACLAALEEDPSTVLAYPQTVLVDAEGEPIEVHGEGSCWTASTPAERFACSLRHWGLMNLPYGLVRRADLEETVLLGDYPGSDFVLIADLAIRGRFRRVDGERFYRRVHAGATAQLDEKELAQFYRPERADPFEGKHLRLMREHLRLVLDAPTGLGQKARMLKELARKASWTRDRLGEELEARLLPRRLRDARSARSP